MKEFDKMLLSEIVEELSYEIRSRYDLPEGSLIKVVSREGYKIYFEWRAFTRNGRRLEFLADLYLSTDRRSDKYFKCPLCGSPTCETDICADCDFMLEVTGDPLRQDIANFHALTRSIADEILYRIDHDIDPALRSAEVVLPAYAKARDMFSRYQTLRTSEYLKELKKRAMVIETGMSDIPVHMPDEILVDGSDEIMRRVNGKWEHRHMTHDFWHPVAKIHR